MLSPTIIASLAQRISDAAAPEVYVAAVASLLSALAQDCHESAGECEAAWQDKASGSPWTRIGKQLERAAARIV